MLGRRQQSNGSGGRTMETYIGPDTKLEGTVAASGSLRIDGHVDGEIQAEGDVVVGESGRVRAGITAANVIIAGEVTGRVQASGRLELMATGRLYGDAVMQTLIVEQGGVLEGTCRMDREEQPRPAEVLNGAQGG